MMLFLTSNKIRHVRVVKISVPLLLFFVFSTFIPVYADRGGIPISVSHGYVYETAQRAIIAWNGTFEVLILSTDVSSSEKAEVMEIMPLPCNPVISKANASSFSVTTMLVNQYFALAATEKYGVSRTLSQSSGGLVKGSHPSVIITFHESIGAHSLTVVRAEEPDDFMQWLDDFVKDQRGTAELPIELGDLIADYLTSNMNYFAIDIIDLDSTTKSVDPLIYKFQTSKLYYPLRISSLFKGETNITLFTVTSNALKSEGVLNSFLKRAQFKIRKEALPDISADMTNLFSDNPQLTYFYFAGHLEEFDSDILAEEITGPDLQLILSATACSTLGLALLWLFITDIRGKNKSIGQSLQRRLKSAWVLTGGFGIGLTFIGLMSAWGQRYYGNMIMSVSGITVNARLGFFLNFAFLCLPLVSLFYYICLLKVGGYWKAGTAALMAVSSLTTFTVVVSSISLVTLESGAIITFAGCVLTVLSGFPALSSLRFQPDEPIELERTKGFVKYIITRILKHAIILVGVSWVLFWIWFTLPIESKLLSFI
jgi:hypothetical protein